MVLRLLHYADLEDTYDDPKQIGRMAGKITQLRDGQTVVIGAGDNIAPGALALTTNCQHTQPFFTAVDAVVDTLGNHDFDYGTDTLISVIRSTPQTWLCANAIKDGEHFGADAGIRPWTILERDNQRLGVFGLANPKTDTRSPGAQSLTFTDPIPAAVEAIEALRDRSVDHVLCVSHLGERSGHNDAIDLARKAAIDVILDGDLDDRPRIDWINDTLIVRTSGKGIDLSEIIYDGSWTATLHTVAEAAVSQTVEQQYQKHCRTVGINRVVGFVATPITCSIRTLFQGESRLGNFITDAYRCASNATVALQHSGGIQGITLQDTITVGDLIRLIPFEKAIAQVEITGSKLSEILASGGACHYPTHPEFWHLHMSGATVTFDYEERELINASVRGEPIDSSNTYSVVAPENFFRSHGVTVAAEHLVFDRQYEPLLDYVEAHDIAPQLEGRITRHGLEEIQ